MGDRSAIEWTDASWNPVTGCSKVSPGCAHCYAEAVSLRFKRSESAWTPANAAQNIVLHAERLEQPLRWRRPRRIFVCSMADLFHEQVPDDYIAQVFAIMGNATRHTFQVLTKRAERMQTLLGDSRFWWTVYRMAQNDPLPPVRSSRVSYSLPNVWLGVSIENRRYVDRADLLRETPAAVRFISAEPLIGPLIADGGGLFSRGADGQYHQDFADGYQGPSLNLAEIDWLIVGGESGRGARAMRDDWVRSLCKACLEQCAYCENAHRLDPRLPIVSCPERRTAFFFKQWGGPRPGGDALLDGREWREFPEVAR